MQILLNHTKQQTSYLTGSRDAPHISTLPPDVTLFAVEKAIPLLQELNTNIETLRDNLCTETHCVVSRSIYIAYFILYRLLFLFISCLNAFYVVFKALIALFKRCYYSVLIKLTICLEICTTKAQNDPT